METSEIRDPISALLPLTDVADLSIQQPLSPLGGVKLREGMGTFVP